MPQRVDTYRTYVRPRKEDWPVCDADAGEYIDYDATRPELESMCDLSPQDSNALAIVRIVVDKKKERESCESGESRPAPSA